MLPKIRFILIILAVSCLLQVLLAWLLFSDEGVLLIGLFVLPIFTLPATLLLCLLAHAPRGRLGGGHACLLSPLTCIVLTVTAAQSRNAEHLGNTLESAIVVSSLAVGGASGFAYLFYTNRAYWFFAPSADGQSSCPNCGYSLQGLNQGSPCPECGNSHQPLLPPAPPGAWAQAAGWITLTLFVIVQAAYLLAAIEMTVLGRCLALLTVLATGWSVARQTVLRRA